MPSSENDQRLTDILNMIGRMAALDFTRELDYSKKHDMLDAIALGLNMLSEELSSQMVEKRELQEVNKRLEKFAFTTAHDLKSPLNSQIGLLQLIELSIDPTDNPEVGEYIQRLKLVNEKMRSLVEGILLHSVRHYKMGQRETVDFNEVLKEIIVTDNLTVKANIILESELPRISFHWSSAIQVFRNILDNAIKYNDKEQCEIRVGGSETPHFHVIWIKDNGPGIEKEYHDKIFDLFKQVNASTDTQTVGIGLATVKNLMDGCGGKVIIESELGKGCSFVLHIPKD